jgi:pyruvyltransferase
MIFKTVKNIFEEAINLLIKEDLNVMAFKSNNIGDYFNKPLIECILKKNVHIVDINIYNGLNLHWAYDNTKMLLGIGSIIQHSPKNAIIWGSGSIWYDSVPKHKPKEILAVRGKLTRNNLIKHGFSCPLILGDPGLLASRYFPTRNNTKSYKLGIIPHYSELKSNVLNQFKNSSEIIIIDITNQSSFFEELLSCEIIASSSLHGLIFADSFQIPNIWISIKNELFGGTFKFCDYYSAIYNKTDLDSFKPMSIEENGIKQLIKCSTTKPIDLDLDKLDSQLTSYFE